MRDVSRFQLRAGTVRWIVARRVVARWIEAVLTALVVLVALVASAYGQSPDASQAAAQDSSTSTQAPAPIQRVAHAARKPFRAARLTYLSGNVIVEQASSKTQDVAVPNMPLVEGTVLSAGDDGQAELEFEDGSVIRVTPNSAVSLLNMSSDSSGNYQTRVAVLGGLVYAELRAGTKFQYSIDAGGDEVTPTENSTIRINLDEPPAQIAVLQGAVHLSNASLAAVPQPDSPADQAPAQPAVIDAQAGQTAQASAGPPDPDQPPFLVKEEVAAETWDQWNEDRDQLAAGQGATQTVARDQFAGDQGYGWSDLDASGSWYNVPGEGEVWQPDAATDSTDASGTGGSATGGFDPYGYGSWVWTPAGYSWASSYGWGWLPYRCGQWVYFDGFGWGWEPGVSCGNFGFGGYGYGGIYVGRAPGGWRHPKRPITGPGPIHPIIHGRSGPVPFAVARNEGAGREVRVRTIGGHTVEPLPPIATASALRGGAAIGAALKRDYPVNSSTHEAALGIAPTRTAPNGATNNGRSAWQTGAAPAGRSNMVPAWPNRGVQTQPAQREQRPQSAPAARSSAPAESHSAPAAASSSQHK